MLTLSGINHWPHASGVMVLVGVVTIMSVMMMFISNISSSSRGSAGGNSRRKESVSSKSRSKNSIARVDLLQEAVVEVVR